jgi:hypothetical protein
MSAIKVNLKQIGYETVDHIHLAQQRFNLKKQVKIRVTQKT